MNARMYRPAAVTAGLLLLLVGLVGADEVYVTPVDYIESRSTATGGITAESAWDGVSDNGFQIRWTIVDLGPADPRWSYSYTLSGVGGTDLSKGLSHWLLQLSKMYDDEDEDDVKAAKVLAEFPDFSPTEVEETKDYSPSDPGNSNPTLPGDIFAVKLAGLDPGEPPQTYGFTSTRAPIWGNFYAIDGKDTVPETSAWNSGFLSDPALVTDGDYTDWIPTPDTVSDPPQSGPIADWGDLPDSYQTTLASDGPRHLDGSHEWLGAAWDAETNGVPSGDATGDDVSLSSDDEDGVEFVNGGVWVTPMVADWQSSRYDDADIYIDGWIDLDQDGTFDEGTADTDHVVSYQANPQDDWGANSPGQIFFKVLGWVPGFGPAGTGYYTRWRISYGSATTWFGEAPFGEVEDYFVTPEPASVVVLAGGMLALLRRRRKRK